MPTSIVPGHRPSGLDGRDPAEEFRAYHRTVGSKTFERLHTSGHHAVGRNITSGGSDSRPDAGFRDESPMDLFRTVR